MRKQSHFLLYFFCVLFFNSTVAQENVFAPAELSGTMRQAITLTGWRYCNGDDLSRARPDFDDSKWDSVESRLYETERLRVGFRGNAWFRKKIKADSGTVLGLQMIQNGASDIYFDGQLLCHFGTVSSGSEGEERYDPKAIPISVPISKTGEHLIAVRYSNHSDSHFPRGFLLGTMDANSSSYWSTEISIGNTFFLSILEGFFTGLALLHFFLFFYYKAEKSNLYYAIFNGSISLVFTCVYASKTYHDPALNVAASAITDILYPTVLVSLLSFVHVIYHRPFSKFFWINFVFAVATALLSLFSIVNPFFLLAVLLTSTSIFTIIQTVRAVIRKQDGARILGTGMLIFFLSLVAYCIRQAMTNDANLNNSDWINTVFLGFLIVGVLSIPVSMSLYLARQFAQISKTIIAQEAEKKKILEGQKEELERQVKERTAEVVHQKQIIEEKNKDITDSINYAKRIQEAILPAKEIKYRIFPDSFVFFQPRDIVSGDFYWFSEKSGRKIIAAADCTGHGVPGAFMSMIGNAFLNEIVNQKGITDPAKILDQLKENIVRSLNQGATGNEGVNTKVNDGMDIALCSLDEKNGILEFAGANNPLWLIRNGECIEYKGDKQPVGLHSGESKPFTSQKITLQKGDAFYLFTDGFADQFGGSKGKKFKYKQMQELILSATGRSMAEQEQILKESINNWMGKMEQVDDILVIGVKI